MRPAFYPFLDASFILAAAWLPFILFGELCARHFDFNGSLARSKFFSGRGSVRAKRFFARSAKRGLIRNHLRVSRFLQSGYGTSLKERKSMSGSDILVALALIGISAYAVGSVVLVWTQGTPCTTATGEQKICTGLEGLKVAWAGVMGSLGLYFSDSTVVEATRCAYSRCEGGIVDLPGTGLLSTTLGATQVFLVGPAYAEYMNGRCDIIYDSSTKEIMFTETSGWTASTTSTKSPYDLYGHGWRHISECPVDSLTQITDCDKLTATLLNNEPFCSDLSLITSTSEAYPVNLVLKSKEKIDVETYSKIIASGLMNGDLQTKVDKIKEFLTKIKTGTADTSKLSSTEISDLATLKTKAGKIADNFQGFVVGSNFVVPFGGGDSIKFTTDTTGTIIKGVEAGALVFSEALVGYVALAAGASFAIVALPIAVVVAPIILGYALTPSEVLLQTEISKDKCAFKVGENPVTVAKNFFVGWIMGNTADSNAITIPSDYATCSGQHAVGWVHIGNTPTECILNAGSYKVFGGIYATKYAVSFCPV